ncbi:MAG TPA: signal peptidase I [Aliidongia sp.]|nr:signal peptidase I [Aliidongia sp.]
MGAKLRQIWGAIREPTLAILLVVFARTALADPFYVPSGSMEPTLLIGDELLATKYAYGYSRYSLPLGLGNSLGAPAVERLMGKLPERGDIVVFNLPRDPSETLVKRVVGLPGDKIQMRAGHLTVNGETLPLQPDGTGEMELEDGRAIAAPRYIETLPGGKTHEIFKLSWAGPLDDTTVYEVPPGHLFMMGDNRDNSLDSRVREDRGGVGFVPVENLVGRVDRLLGSDDYKAAEAKSIWSWPGTLRLSRFLASVG